MGAGRLELPHPKALDPKSSASTNSATLPTQYISVPCEEVNIIGIHTKSIKAIMTDQRRQLFYSFDKDVSE